MIILFYFTSFGSKSLLLTPGDNQRREENTAMTDQELKKLSRKDLLELLIIQGRERDSLKAELEKAKAALEDRKIQIEKAGSIAEAALQLNGVFEAAQAAAQQYVENIRRCSRQIEEKLAKWEEACAGQEDEKKGKIRQELLHIDKLIEGIEERNRCTFEELMPDAEGKTAGEQKEGPGGPADSCRQFNKRTDQASGE